MGNCLRNNKVLAQDYENYSCEEKIEEVKTFPPSKLEATSLEQCMKKKNKKVRFKIENDGEGDGDSRSGNNTVRIRVVMTQEELKNMLSYKDDADSHTSLEQLLCAMRLRGGKFSVSHDVGEIDGSTNSWRPALESIPEERLLK